MMKQRQFASDNNAGVVEEVMRAIELVNHEHVGAYGEDSISKQAREGIEAFWGRECEVLFCSTGTGANVLSLSAMCERWEGCVCHALSHMNTDECGAPEAVGRVKLLTVGGGEGKIDLKEAETLLRRGHGIHGVKPAVVSVTQVTELGTVYSIDELKRVREFADQWGMKMHIDGARIFNALIRLGVNGKEFMKEVKPDGISFGGTKVGGMACEAVVLFDWKDREKLEYLRKQQGQLVSKMRFIAAQWIGILGGGVGMKYAKHANEMTQILAEKIEDLTRIGVLHSVDANAVFIDLDPKDAKKMFEKGWRFYDFLEPRQHRLMCSWDTRIEDVEAIVNDLKDVVGD